MSGAIINHSDDCNGIQWFKWYLSSVQRRHSPTFLSQKQLSHNVILILLCRLCRAMICIHSACNSLLSTEYQRRQYYQKDFPNVHPQIIFLKRDDKRKQCNAYSIEEHFTNHVERPSCMGAVCQASACTLCDVICDISDGSVFKSNDLFKQPEIAIQLILYQDAFEIVNPLGSA